MTALPIATIGHNNPPEPTPYEKAQEEISSLYDEANLWLDGAVVDSQELADGIGNLLNMLRAAVNRAEEARKAEAKPFDDGKAEVQARYGRLIADTKTQKGKAILAMEACKKALAPWLEKLEAEKRAAAEAERRKAEELAQAAQEAIRATDSANLEQRAEAEALLQEAKKADRAATRAEKDGAKAGSGAFGRAVSLRTIYTPIMTNSAEALKHYKATKPEELKAFLLSLAEADVRAGKRAIPGFEVREEKRPV